MLYRFKKEKEIAYASILYTVTTFIFYLGMMLLAGVEYFRAAVIGEFVLILLPALLFIEIGIVRGKKELLRLNKIKISSVLNIILMLIFVMPLFGLLNNLIYFLFSRIFGAVEIYSTPVPNGTNELILSILVLALVPAVSEEVFFRGILQGIFRRHGHMFSIVLTGILFSLLHLDIQRFISIAILGSFIGYIVYRTNSLYAGMIAHFTNNTIAVIISYLFQDESIYIDGINRITKEGYSIFMTTDAIEIISSAILIVISGTIFIAIFRRFIKSTATTHEVKVATNLDRSARGYLFLIPALAFIILLYVLQSRSIIDGMQSFLDIVVSSFYN